MEHTLPALPYAIDALAPHYSRETLEFHHGKHHNAYVVNLNNLQKGTEFESKTLEEIIKTSSGGIYNNSAQIWNHTFFWNCMKPAGGGEPTGALGRCDQCQMGQLRRVQGSFCEVGPSATSGSGLDLAGQESRWQRGHRQHRRGRHAADDRRQGPG
jgi:Fe-Mn family superoxide dismutase